MTAKEYLQQIRKLDIQIRNKQLELRRIELLMSGVKALDFEKKETAASKSSLSPQEKYYPLYEKYEKSIKNDVDKLVHLKHEAIKLIDSIDDADCIDVLYKRYVLMKRWEVIAIEMNFSYPHIHRIHERALNLLNEKMIQNETLLCDKIVL